MAMVESTERKTLILDIDGTLVMHHGKGLKGQFDEPLQVLPGVIKKFHEWDTKSYNIILLTGRRESHRAETERQLRDAGLFWDQLVMGVGPGPRYLINDGRFDGTVMTFAINVKRNGGLEEIDV